MAGIQFSVAPQLPARLTGVAPVSVTKSGLSYSISLAGYLINRVNQALPPTVNDDATDGFDYGSRWVMTTGVEYVCTNPTTGAAVWVIVGADTFSELSGNIAVGQMAGGVGADATTVWAGDGSWKRQDSANVDFLQQGTGAVIRSMQSKGRDHFHLQDYGTPTAGDNSTLINTAIAAVNAAGGGYLTMPRGTTPATAITLLPKVTLIGSGKGTASVIQNIGTSLYLLRGDGSYGTPVAITVDVGLGETVLQVASTAGLAAGDAIVISDDYSYEPTDAGYKSGETVYIKSVDSGVQLTLLGPLFGSMFTGRLYTVPNSATIRKVNFLESPCIADLKLASSQASATIGIGLYGARKAIIDSVFLEDWGNAGQILSGCADSDIIDGGCDTLRDDLAALRAGYGVLLEGACQGIKIVGNRWRNTRHGFATGGTTTGYPHTVLVEGNQCYDNSQSGIDTHNAGDDISIIGNTVTNCYSFGASGISLRARGTTVKSNVIINPASHGITVVNTGGLTRSDITIDDNDIINTGGHGISCAVSVPNLRITNNRLKFIGQDGITLFASGTIDSTGLVISKNEVIGYSLLTASRYGLLTSGGVTTTGAVISDNFFDPLAGLANYAIRTLALTGSACVNNKARGTFAAATFDFGTNTDINNKKIDAANAETVLTKASTTARASLNIPHGAAPTTPVNGDMWTTTAGAFVQINGVTKTFTLT